MPAGDDESDEPLRQGPLGQFVDREVPDDVVDAVQRLPKDEARAFAAQMPTVSEPTSPGPAATATASTSDRPAPASDMSPPARCVNF